MRAFSNDFIAAYGGLLQWLGILIAAASIANFAHYALSVPFPDLAKFCINQFRQALHLALGTILSWVRLEFPPELLDVIGLWMIAAGCLLRAALRARTSFDRWEESDLFNWIFQSLFPTSHRSLSSDAKRKESVALYVYIVVKLTFYSVLVVPMAFIILKEGVISSQEGPDRWAHGSTTTKTYLYFNDVDSKQYMIEQGSYVMDLRFVFAMQLAAALAIVATFAALNFNPA